VIIAEQLKTGQPAHSAVGTAGRGKTCMAAAAETLRGGADLLQTQHNLNGIFINAC
jgi:hypothetical protein